MKERAISVTEASRNFAECINRVRYQGLSFLLVKNGTAVARLVPATGAAHAILEGKTEPEEPTALPASSPAAEPPERRPAQLEAGAQSENAPAAAPIFRDRSLQW